MTRPIYYNPQAFLKSPEHPGETMAEFRERKAKRWRAIRQALWVLAGVALIVAMWVMG